MKDQDISQEGLAPGQQVEWGAEGGQKQKPRDRERALSRQNSR